MVLTAYYVEAAIGCVASLAIFTIAAFKTYTQGGWGGTRTLQRSIYPIIALSAFGSFIRFIDLHGFFFWSRMVPVFISNNISFACFVLLGVYSVNMIRAGYTLLRKEAPTWLTKVFLVFEAVTWFGILGLSITQFAVEDPLIVTIAIYFYFAATCLALDVTVTVAGCFIINQVVTMVNEKEMSTEESNTSKTKPSVKVALARLRKFLVSINAAVFFVVVINCFMARSFLVAGEFVIAHDPTLFKLAYAPIVQLFLMSTFTGFSWGMINEEIPSKAGPGGRVSGEKGSQSLSSTLKDSFSSVPEGVRVNTKKRRVTQDGHSSVESCNSVHSQKRKLTFESAIRPAARKTTEPKGGSFPPRGSFPPVAVEVPQQSTVQEVEEDEGHNSPHRTQNPLHLNHTVNIDVDVDLVDVDIDTMRPVDVGITTAVDATMKAADTATKAVDATVKVTDTTTKAVEMTTNAPLPLTA